jgi:hypothetical protein
LARTGGASRFIFEQHLCQFGSKSVDNSFERSRTMKRQSILVLVTTTFLFFPIGSQNAEADPTIIGETTLLTYSDAQQLETWLGKGPIYLTNIFTKTIGDGQSSIDFHSGVDGQGQTFSIVEVLETRSNSHQIIGGYNPQSWSSPSRPEYYFTDNDSERTAFLFNLTTTDIQRQVLSQPIGRYQTVNGFDYGPTFGVGHDLHVWSSLSEGSACAYSYGIPTGINIIGRPHSYSEFDVGTIEIFKITPVPAPVAVLLGSIGLTFSGWLLRRRRPSH